MTDTELQTLQAEIAALKEQVRELQRRLEPAAPAPRFEAGPPTPGTTEIALGRLRMSAEAMKPMLDAVPNDLLRQVSSDRFAKAPASMAPEPAADTREDPNPNQKNTSGWRSPRPLKSGLQQ
jgi:hypothetical protein